MRTQFKALGKSRPTRYPVAILEQQTIVPLDDRILDSGEVYIRAIDSAYATPGPDEAQKFGLAK